MSGSDAEKRIRAKAERALRDRFPQAAIVHELPIGGCRLDLAAITPTRMVVVEVKSEKDTLARLGNQIRSSLPVAAEVWICTTVHHKAALELMQRSQIIDDDHKVPFRNGGGYTYEPNPDYLPELYDADIFIETDAGFDFLQNNHRISFGDHPMDRLLDPRALLRLLIKPELMALTGLKASRTCEQIIRAALDNLTGLQIREGVYSALRARYKHFPDRYRMAVAA